MHEDSYQHDLHDDWLSDDNNKGQIIGKRFHLAMKHNFHILYHSHLTKEEKCNHSSSLRENFYPGFVHS